jgi:hypothetical protein
VLVITPFLKTPLHFAVQYDIVFLKRVIERDK